METTLAGLIAYGAFVLTAGLGLSINLPNGTKTLSQTQIQAIGVAYVLGCLSAIAVLWIAVRMARRGFAEYLALNWPSLRELLLAVAIMAILLLLESLARYVLGVNNTVIPYFRIERTAGFLIFLIGACLVAPLMEEFIFRGFLFRGWSESLLGPIRSIVVTSIIWGMSHTQYDWFGRFWIFIRVSL